MTLKQILTKRFDVILWAALIALVMLYIVRCNGSNKKLQAIEAAAKSLEAKVKADSIERNRERHNFLRAKAESEATKELLAIEKEEATKAVSQQQKTIDRLASVIRNTTGKPVDSSFVLVSPAFKKACDSFPTEVAALNLALADRDTAINSMLDLYDYEIQIRDEELFKEMNYSDSLKVDFVRQTKLLKAALQQGKPRGRLLGGISVLGNQNQFLSGAGVVLAYQTKGGKQYQVSPKFIKLPGTEAEVFYEGTVLFTIFK